MGEHDVRTSIGMLVEEGERLSASLRLLARRYDSLTDASRAGGDALAVDLEYVEVRSLVKWVTAAAKGWCDGTTAMLNMCDDNQLFERHGGGLVAVQDGVNDALRGLNRSFGMYLDARFPTQADTNPT